MKTEPLLGEPARGQHICSELVWLAGPTTSRSGGVTFLRWLRISPQNFHSKWVGGGVCCLRQVHSSFTSQLIKMFQPTLKLLYVGRFTYTYTEHVSSNPSSPQCKGGHGVAVGKNLGQNSANTRHARARGLEAPIGPPSGPDCSPMFAGVRPWAPAKRPTGYRNRGLGAIPGLFSWRSPGPL